MRIGNEMEFDDYSSCIGMLMEVVIEIFVLFLCEIFDVVYLCV